MLSCESDKIAVSSGMVRLSCPHLVKAIDELEASGGLEEMNTLLANEREDGKYLRSSFFKVNAVWGAVRRVIMDEEDIQVAQNHLGTTGASKLINSGIIGKFFAPIPCNYECYKILKRMNGVKIIFYCSVREKVFEKYLKSYIWKYYF